jgi:hypothetical protein
MDLKEYIKELENRQDFLNKVIKKTENPCRYLELTSRYDQVRKIIKELNELEL